MSLQRHESPSAQRLARRWPIGDLIYDTDLGKYFFGDMVTLGGIGFEVVEGGGDDVTLGSFTGTTIPDNATIKSALQALESEVEAKANQSDETITGSWFFTQLIQTSGIRPSGNNESDLGALALRYRDLFLAGDVIVDGLVDGRDVAADGNTLDALANVPQVSESEKSSGSQTDIRTFSPADVRDMAVRHGGGGSGGSDSRGFYEQSTPASVWTVTHNLGYRPPVAVLDTTGDEVICSINHVSDNQLTVTHAIALAGTVVW